MKFEKKFLDFLRTDPDSYAGMLSALLSGVGVVKYVTETGIMVVDISTSIVYLAETDVNKVIDMVNAIPMEYNVFRVITDDSEIQEVFNDTIRQRFKTLEVELTEFYMYTRKIKDKPTEVVREDLKLELITEDDLEVVESWYTKHNTEFNSCYFKDCIRHGTGFKAVGLDGGIQGIYTVINGTLRNTGVYEYNALIVFDEFLHRGVGKFLLSNIINKALEDECYPRALVEVGNEVSINIHEKFGYTKARKTVLQYRAIFDDETKKKTSLGVLSNWIKSCRD